MIAAIADPHVVIWYLSAESLLSEVARSFIEGLAARGDQVGVSTITLIESIYLVEKGRLPERALQQMLDALAENNGLFREVAVDRSVADVLSQVPRDQVPDLPDRIIAATAVLLNVPLISRDRQIATTSLRTIW
jgi:PIN domain nuclease of toxin-antitoxin system